MTLIVEDGTGKADAESYASVAYADARMAAMGMTIWTELNEPEKEQALRRATQYMEDYYRLKWKGTRTTTVQALNWPRTDVYVPDGPGDGLVEPYSLPIAVVNACADLALRAAAGPLYADESRPYTRAKVADIEVEYSEKSSQAVRYRTIEASLAIYTMGNFASLSLVRS